MVKRADTTASKTTDKDKKKDKPKLPPRSCKGCGIMFVPKSRREKYHNASCREEHYQKTFFCNEPVQKVCPNCGNVFTTTKPGRQDYCDEDCRKAAAQKRRDGIVSDIVQERQKFYTARMQQMKSDGFRCTTCGKTAKDGVKLDVYSIDDDGTNATLCDECALGMGATLRLK